MATILSGAGLRVTSPLQIARRPIFPPQSFDIIMSAQGKPSSSQHTLRFKSHRTTILLLVTPTDPFTTIKSALLSSLRATGLQSLPLQDRSAPIPNSPDDVILGVPVDRNDYSKGWVDLLIPEADHDENGDEDGGGGGGGKVKKGSVLNESPLGAGLRDGDVIAFRFRGEGEREGEKTEEWDVVIPSYEEEDAEEEARKMET
ncbi:hypothetical protein G7Y79_00012g033410 [Physcia stellaris]|nr:hypothetical protein G7Y79_00012g033410 [Physcia stellaris]